MRQNTSQLSNHALKYHSRPPRLWHACGAVRSLASCPAIVIAIPIGAGSKSSCRTLYSVPPPPRSHRHHIESHEPFLRPSETEISQKRCIQPPILTRTLVPTSLREQPRGSGKPQIHPFWRLISHCQRHRRIPNRLGRPRRRSPRHNPPDDNARAV